MKIDFKKFFSGRWARLVSSLFFTLLIVFYVSANTAGNGQNNSQNILSSKSATVTVPLSVKFDSNKYYVTGAPKNIQVKISGSSALVLAAKQSSVLSATADLSDPKIGSQKLKIKLNGFAESLSVKPSKEYITVTVSEIVKKSFTIQTSYNRENIADGYKVDSITPSTKKATVIGPKELVESVDHLIAVVDVPNGLKKNATENAVIKAVDKSGTEVDVDINPETVSVAIEVSADSSDSSSDQITKTVSIAPDFSGSKNINDYNITYSSSVVQITGNKDVLGGISSIPLKINLDDFSQNGGAISYLISTPDGVSAITPQRIEVTLKLKSISGSGSN